MKIKKFRDPKFLSIIGGFALLTAVNFLLLKTAFSLRGRYNKLISEIKSKNAEITKYSSENSTKQKIEAEITQINSDISVLKEKIFLNSADIFLFINRFAEASKISISSIEPLEKTETEIPDSKDIYIELPINVKVKCDYSQLLDFLHNIENAQKLIIVSDIKIEGDVKNIWEHNITITVKAPILSLQNSNAQS